MIMSLRLDPGFRTVGISYSGDLLAGLMAPSIEMFFGRIHRTHSYLFGQFLSLSSQLNKARYTVDGFELLIEEAGWCKWILIFIYLRRRSAQSLLRWSKKHDALNIALDKIVSIVFLKYLSP